MKGPLKFIFLCAVLFTIKSGAQTTTQLTVRGFSEGYYRPAIGKMVAKIDTVNFPMMCDTGFIQIIDTATNQSVFCTDVIIKTDGYGFCNVPAYLYGEYMKVSIKFRNSLHVVSKNVVRMTGNAVSVDLTIPQNVCCDVDTTYGVAKAYSGDLNGDGTFDGSDFLILDPDLLINKVGYSLTDLNGDWVVDSIDFNILDHNIMISPSGSLIGACAVNDVKVKSRKQLDVFPNPFSNTLRVQLMRTYRSIEFSVFDATGRIFERGEATEVSSVEIDSESYPPGMYYIRMKAEGELRQEAIVIKVK